MMKKQILTSVFVVIGALVTAAPAFAQFEFEGSYTIRMYEDYIERGPGSDLGDYTGMALSDEGRAKALLYTSNQPSTLERQCLAQSPWVIQYRPLGLRVWTQTDRNGRIVAYVMGGDYLRDNLTIWMDGRPHPSPNALHSSGGFSTGKWEGDTLTVKTDNVKAQWIRRGVGIPGSDESTFTVHFTLHGNMLTVTTIQNDPIYLTEPHVVTRIWEKDTRPAAGGGDVICNTASEIPRLEDSGIVPHYLPGQNPEADHMMRDYNLPKEAAMGYAESLYPEFRKKIRNTYKAPASCDRYCCGWVERQGLPGAAPGLSCVDGGQKAKDPLKDR